MKVSPRRLAAASRALQGVLLDAIALRSAAMSNELAERFMAVPWDRQRLIGQIQESLHVLREARFPLNDQGGVRVTERARQPFECIEEAWRQVRQGRAVWVDREPGSCVEGLELLRAMGSVLGFGVLQVANEDRPPPEEIEQWPRVGVELAPRRIVAVAEDADPELAAYFVARASLRRTGFDPRCVHRVLVAGERKRFERHLRRLFVGARIGAPNEAGAFAGGVSEEQAVAFESDLNEWRQGSGNVEACRGGRLEVCTKVRRGGVKAVYLAPALFVVEGEELRGDPRGPCLIIQRVHEGKLETQLRETLEATEGERAWAWVGEADPKLARGPKDRWIRGALAVSRLPPGLPLPRP